MEKQDNMKGWRFRSMICQWATRPQNLIQIELRYSKPITFAIVERAICPIGIACVTHSGFIKLKPPPNKLILTAYCLRHSSARFSGGRSN